MAVSTATATQAKKTEMVRGRQTQPGSYSPYTYGGLGIIPRRGMDRPDSLLSGALLADYAIRNPQRILVLLRSMHPSLAAVTDSILGLLCPPGAIRIVAVKESAEGEGDETTDDAGTALLCEFFEGLPNEIGGIDGLASSMILSLLFGGMACVEGVPGPSGQGLAAAWPVDPLTIVFGRDPETSALLPYQAQQGGLGGPYKPLSSETFHWCGLDTYPDDPYPDPRFASALNECLADLRLAQDTRDAFHHIAWPRMVFEVDVTDLIKFAMEVMHLDQDPAKAWAMERYEEFVQHAETMKADDTFFVPSNGKVYVLEGGKGFGNNTAVMEFFERRKSQSLKTLPFLLGINDSTTETQAKVQLEVQAKQLERLRSTAVSVPVWLANLHLRLLGSPLKAKAEYEPIRTGEALTEAQAEEIQIRNESEKVRLGYITPEQASIKITGSGLADPKRAEEAASQPKQPAQPAKDAKPGEQTLQSISDASELARATSWEHVWRGMGISEAEQARIRKERSSLDVTFDNAQ